MDAPGVCPGGTGIFRLSSALRPLKTGHETKTARRAHRPAALSSRKGRPRLLAVFLLVALFLLVLLTLFALVLFTVLAVAVLHTDTPFRLS